jgi:hypothetical protein
MTKAVLSFLPVVAVQEYGYSPRYRSIYSCLLVSKAWKVSSSPPSSEGLSDC